MSQRLVVDVRGGRCLATEIMVNSGLIRSLIEEGKVRNMKEMIERNTNEGMHSFDQSLFQLFRNGRISQETAIAEADNEGDMRLKIRQLETTEKIEKDQFHDHINLSKVNDEPFEI